MKEVSQISLSETAAVEIADRANTQGWPSVAGWLEEAMQSSAWQDWIVVLASKLNDPLPLLETLARSEVDDIFRHRLCLAVRCAQAAMEAAARRGGEGGVTMAASQRLAEAAQGVANQLFDLWWNHEGSRLLEHFKRSLPAVATIDSHHILDKLVAALRSSASKEANDERPVKALENMARPLSRRPDLVQHLVESLQNSDFRLAGCAARVLAAIGKECPPEAIDQLTRLLQNPGSAACQHAVEALAGMAEVPCQQLVLKPLLDCLRDDRLSFRVAPTLAKMGQTLAQYPWAIQQLLTSLCSPQSDARFFAVTILAGLDENTAREAGVVKELAQSLENSMKCLREGAFHEAADPVIRALGGMGKTAAEHPGVIENLVECLRAWKRYPSFVCSAIEAFGRLGEAAATRSGLVSQLLEGLQNREPYVPDNHAMALRALGEAAGRQPDVIDRLLDYLQDGTAATRISAVRVLGKMGRYATQHPGVLQSLRLALRDPVYSVCTYAAVSLGELANSGLDPEPVALALLDCLRDPDWHPKAPPPLPKGPVPFPRCSALRVLGALGENTARQPAPTDLFVQALRAPDTRFCALQAVLGMGEVAGRQPSIVGELARCLHEQDSNLARLATETLGWMTEPAVDVGVLECLLQKLQAKDPSLQFTAAGALTNMMSRGARFYRSASGELQVRWLRRAKCEGSTG